MCVHFVSWHAWHTYSLTLYDYYATGFFFCPILTFGSSKTPFVIVHHYRFYSKWPKRELKKMFTIRSRYKPTVKFTTIFVTASFNCHSLLIVKPGMIKKKFTSGRNATLNKTICPLSSSSHHYLLTMTPTIVAATLHCWSFRLIYPVATTLMHIPWCATCRKIKLTMSLGPYIQ